MSEQIKLNLQGPLNTLSYGVVTTNLASELAKVCDLRIIEIGGNRSQLPHHDGHSLKIWHQNRLMDHVGKGLKIGFPIFELDTFSDEEKHHISYLDKVLVCSQWARDLVLPINPNVFVVPLGVDRTIFQPPIRRAEGSFLFYTVGKWEVRKSHHELIECFNSAFTPKDDVELHLFCDNPFPFVDSKSWERYAKSGPMGQKITVHPRFDSQTEMVEKLKLMHCGLFLSKAEGWNLGLLEAMSMGHKVIATNYSGHTEFVTTKNSSLIQTDELEKADDGVWFKGTGNWGKFGLRQKEATIEAMRQATIDRSQNIAGIETAKWFSWENSAAKVVESVLLERPLNIWSEN